MKHLPSLALLLALLVSVCATPPPAKAADCEFVLGFKTIHDLIPSVVGGCLANEHVNPANGDSLQETTGTRTDGDYGGLLVWRKGDNFTSFTDGYRTWVNGPFGVQQRLSTERFEWEVVAQLRNAEYSLPVGLRPNDKETTFRMVNGRWDYNSPPVRANAGLWGDLVAVGDLNGDGVPDAAAPVDINTGGSGIFFYLVSFVDRNGVLVQSGQEFLGDRVKLNSITIANRQITVDMIAHGPKDPMCCPTQHVVKVLEIQITTTGSPSSGGKGDVGLPAGDTFEDEVWKLESYLGTAGKEVQALPGAPVTAEFRSGKVSGSAGCNRYGAAYQAGGGNLKIVGPIAATRMTCADPTGVMDQEATYLSVLASASSYRTSGSKLEIANAEGTTVLTFSNAPSLVGTGWTWQNLVMGDGLTLTPSDPGAYTLEFLPGGQFAIRADCNRGGGRYEVRGNQLALQGLITTAAQCPPGSLYGEYLKRLKQVAMYTIRDGNLILDLKLDSGSMTFTAASTAGEAPKSAVDALNATYIIENKPVTLVKGRADQEIIPGAASRTRTMAFGKPATGDLNGDGVDDAALILTQNSGGSGTFFYVVAAIYDPSSSKTVGTNAVLLGDRVAPQNTNIDKGVVQANYADRKPGEPMAAQPSVGVTKRLVVEGATLKEVDR